MVRRTSLIALIILLCFACCAQGATYYCDPVSGNTADNNGLSPSTAWGTFESILVYPNNKFTYTIVGGDTVKLMTGYHGYPNKSGIRNDGYVTIEPADGNSPTLRGLKFSAGGGLIFSNLTISPELTPGEYTPLDDYLINIVDHPSDGNVYDITVEDCNIYSVLDISGWDANDWDANASSAIKIIGPNSILRNNTIHNVNYGIICGGENSLVEDNTITNFGIDGLRVESGDNQVWQYNTVKNLYMYNSAAHADILQVYSTSGLCPKNLTIRGNYGVDAEDPNQPLRSFTYGEAYKLNAGIVCAQSFTDETYDWVIENNVFIVPWQGISVENPNSIEIINNTLMRPSYSPYDTTYPNIILAVDSGGPELSADAVIRNNIAGAFPDANATRNIEVDHNIDFDDEGDFSALFTDYANYDLTLKDGDSNAVDTGDSNLAPSIDILKYERPAGEGYDIGAYEYGTSGGDSTPPTPNPATFSSPPAATGTISITMTATTASDDSSPVEYSFVETTGHAGATNSGWRVSASYTDSGLSAGTEYTYTVQTRDSLENTGTASSGSSATTDPEYYLLALLLGRNFLCREY